MDDFFKGLKPGLQKELARIPRTYKTEEASRMTLFCELYRSLKEKGLTPIPGFRPPRRPQGQVALLGLNREGEIVLALCVEPIVTLEGVRSLEATPAGEKWVVTFSENEKKLKESTFFLSPSIKHLHVPR
jgi:hypothetical protein